VTIAASLAGAGPAGAAVVGLRVLPPWFPAAATGAAGGGLVFLLAHRGLIDDAYITLDYARTLARYGQWALEPGHPTNTATSPLNVVLLAVLIGLCGAPVLSVGVLLTLTLAATGAALSVICAQLGCDRRLAVAAVALLAVNPLLISTTGLETYLAVALIATLGAAVLACRPVTAGLVCGLLGLTRADLAAFGLAGLIGLATRCRAGTRLQRAGQVLGVAAAVGLPWFAASWWWLGSAIPDTLLFKVSEVWEGNSFASGLWHYARGYPVATVLAVLPAAAGIVAVIGCVAAWLARKAARSGCSRWCGHRGRRCTSRCTWCYARRRITGTTGRRSRR
jgi:hypothetical protein